MPMLVKLTMTEWLLKKGKQLLVNLFSLDRGKHCYKKNITFWKYFNRSVLILLVPTALIGCSPTRSQVEWANYENAVKTYNATALNAEGQLQKSKATYYTELSNIAYHHGQYRVANVWWMLANESSLQAAGQPNNVNSIEARLNAGDKSIADEAEIYRINIGIQNKCASFGYRAGSPDFNKCVYDLKIQYLQAKQAIQQQIWSAPVSLPAYSTTRCINTVSGVTCNSYRY